MDVKKRKRDPDPDKYPEVGKRIIYAMRYAKITNFAELAKETEHSPQVISDRVNGKVDLSLDIAEDIARVCGVRPQYLLQQDNYMTEKYYERSIINKRIKSELSKIETNATYSLFSLWGIDVEPNYTNGLLLKSSSSLTDITSDSTTYERSDEITINQVPDLYFIRMDNDLHIMTRSQWEEYLKVLEEMIKSITVHTLSLLSDSSESIKKQLRDEGIDLRPSEDILAESMRIREAYLKRQAQNKKEYPTDSTRGGSPGL